MKFSLLFALVLPALHAQASFEVASLKPSSPKTRTFGLYTWPGGRITGENCTLEYLIEQAYDILPFQISGPNWVHEDRFDLEARPPASSKSSRSNPSNDKLPPNDEQRQMLQVLLADRFALKYHKETREATVYLLTRNKKDLKLQPSKDADAYPWAGSARGGAPFAQGIAGTNITMALFAKRLSAALGHPVLDQTGIEGSFDFKSDYIADNPQDPDIVASILTSIQGLGLKLESGKGPVETIVIDHAEKPSAN
jgi:uncharacterized protein (TIGR03435 family)